MLHQRQDLTRYSPYMLSIELLIVLDDSWLTTQE